MSWVIFDFVVNWLLWLVPAAFCSGGFQCREKRKKTKRRGLKNGDAIETSEESYQPEGLPNYVEDACYKRTMEQTDDLDDFGRRAG